MTKEQAAPWDLVNLDFIKGFFISLMSIMII